MENKEYQKKWKAENKEHIKKYQKQYMENKKEKYRENYKIRNKTLYKYGKAIECLFCRSTEKVEHHHYTEPYEVDKFIDLCEKCHKEMEVMKMDKANMLKEKVEIQNKVIENLILLLMQKNVINGGDATYIYETACQKH